MSFWVALAIAAAIAFLIWVMMNRGGPATATPGGSGGTGGGAFTPPAPFPNPSTHETGEALVQGRWTSAPELIETQQPSVEYVWRSYRVDQTAEDLAAPILARAIRFVLEGNSAVTIVGIGNNGSVAADGRSGIGGTDENGNVSVYLRGSVQDLSTGALWGIDELLTPPKGAAARFEVN
jgi:hypothetical protein